MDRKAKFISTSLLLCFIVFAEANLEPCNGPDNNIGVCKLINDCPLIFDEIKQMIKLGKSKDEMKNYISEKKCGDSSSNTPYVCCPSTKQCMDPDGVKGTCIKADDCSTMKAKFIEMQNQGATQTELLLFYRQLRCEEKGTICCPTATEVHKNVHLLPTECGLTHKDRLANGEDSDLGQFPWIAALKYYNKDKKDEFLCGGTLINKKYILTAAHCVTKELIGVRLGEHNFLTEEDCPEDDSFDIDECSPPVQDMLIEESIVHTSYSKISMTNDIALIKLKSEAIYNSAVSPICLPTAVNDVELYLVNKTFTIAGWGLTENGRTSDILQRASVPVLSPEYCQGYYRKLNLTNDRICAGGVNSRATCQGDSGGPLMLELRSGLAHTKQVQYGIVSLGSRMCTGNSPSIFVNVPSYMNWILDNLKP